MTQLQQQNWLQQNWPLKTRALFLALLLSLSAAFIIGLPITRASVEQLELQSVQLRNTLSKQVSIQASEAIFSQDLLSLNVILSTLIKDPLIRYGAVYNLNNEIIAEQGFADTEQGQPLSIRYQNEVIGLLEIRLDRTTLDQSIGRLYGLWFVLSTLLCIIGGLIGWLSGRYLGRKIEQTQRQIQRLGEAGAQMSIHTMAELKPLSQTLAEHHQTLLGQAAVSQALNHFLGNPQHHSELNQGNSDNTPIQQHAAALFINPINLPVVQAQLSASEFAALLNQYDQLIQQATALYNGHVERRSGKGITVFFGVPAIDNKDCFHGVCSALLMIGLINAFNQARNQRQLPVIDFQLGLHGGNVTFTQLDEADTPANINQGSTLQLTERLTRKAQANRLLISEYILTQGALAGQLILNKHESITDHNNEQTLATYWVDNFTPNYQALIDRQVQHICSQQLHSIS